jgi:hypothetical protein
MDIYKNTHRELYEGAKLLKKACQKFLPSLQRLRGELQSERWAESPPRKSLQAIAGRTM